MDRVAEILHYWFGEIAENALPTEHRTQIWFGGAPSTDEEIRLNFLADLESAIAGKYAEWENTPRSSLALIIILDQFSRNIYRASAQAYAQDAMAITVSSQGIKYKFDHMLSLMERAFFYLPLMHAENLESQKMSVKAYESLVTLSFPEVQPIFERFLHYAIVHQNIIIQFKRFPQRNKALSRISTSAELQFLQANISMG